MDEWVNGSDHSAVTKGMKGGAVTSEDQSGPG